MATVNLYSSVTASAGQQCGTALVRARFSNSNVTATAVGAQASIFLPSGMTGVSWTATFEQNTAGAPPAGPASGSGNFTNIPFDLPSGSYVDIDYTVSLSCSQPLGTFNVDAYIRPSALDVQSQTGINRASTTITVYEKQVDLRVVKSVLGEVMPGRRATFIVEVENTTATTITIAPGTTVDDAMPAGFVLRRWTAVYSGGASGPSTDISLPVVLGSLPPGAKAIFTIEAWVKSSTQPGAYENCAKATLPRGFLTTANSNVCASACVSFLVVPMVPAPCHSFEGKVSQLVCNPDKPLSGSFSVELVSPGKKVWLPTSPRCPGQTGRGAPLGVCGILETGDIDENGCWRTKYEYPRNGDLIVGCDQEESHPATYYKITETTSCGTNEYRVRLWSDGEYDPCVFAADIDELNPFCFPRLSDDYLKGSV